MQYFEKYFTYFIIVRSTVVNIFNVHMVTFVCLYVTSYGVRKYSGRSVGSKQENI